jgi:hypothetical protein
MSFFVIKDPDLTEDRVADRSIIASPEEQTGRKGRATITDDGVEFAMCKKCTVGLSQQRVRPVRLRLEPALPFDFRVEVQGYFIAADWVSEVFEKENVSGLTRSRVFVHDDNETEIPEPEGSPGGVFCFDVMGKGGDINADDSIYLDGQGREVKRRYKICRKCGNMRFEEGHFGLRFKHLVFHLSAWDGSDCFEVGFLGTVVTERFLEILKSHGIKNWGAIEVYGE